MKIETIHTPIFDFLLNHARQNPVSFHMPGHKGAAFYKRFGYDRLFEGLMDYDITEIPGADNLFQAESIIGQVQDKYAGLYDVKHSYLLINGTSGGILAAILASVARGGRLIMARNCHKSVFNALTLGDIQPIYAYPKLTREGITGAISVEEIEALLNENQDADAVILPSPNYYGICSDIEAIGRIVHQYGKVLIVDQAHGAHLKFFNKWGIGTLPKSAEECGADIVINSIHKTLASFTQSAVLNLNTDRISKCAIEDKLQCIESTSPSYLLMASLDINGEILNRHGQILIKEWEENLDFFYREAAQIESLLCFPRTRGFDYTKINVSLKGSALSGEKLERLLNQAYRIYIELYTGNYTMCMSGIGNTRTDYERLLTALEDIDRKQRRQRKHLAVQLNGEGSRMGSEFSQREKGFPLGKAELFEIPKRKEKILLEEAEGRICASSLIPYPPGIPVVCPGEKLSREIIAYIIQLRRQGEKVIGVTKENEIYVGEEICEGKKW